MREGAFARPARSNSSTPCGSSSADALTASRCDHVAMFHTNSPVSSALRTESLRAPDEFWFDENMTIGGSNVTFWNWLNGARLCRPSRSTVEIQPIGRGITHDLNGSCGRPCGVTPGS